MEQLLKHHIDDTRSRFEDIRNDLQDIRLAISELRDFKVESVSNSKFISVVISVVSGILTFIVSIISVIKIKGD